MRRDRAETGAGAGTGQRVLADCVPGPGVQRIRAWWIAGFILRVTVRTAGRWWPYPKCVPFRDRRHEMSKLRWLLAALGMTLIGLVPVLVSSSSASADPGAILRFDVMTPVTGPYVGTMNPIRTVPGGGLPWMIGAGEGSLSRDGRVQIHVRGLVLADNPRSRPACGAPTRSPTSRPSSAARPSPAAWPPSPTSAPASSRPARGGTPTSGPG